MFIPLRDPHHFYLFHLKNSLITDPTKGSADTFRQSKQHLLKQFDVDPPDICSSIKKYTACCPHTLLTLSTLGRHELRLQQFQGQKQASGKHGVELRVEVFEGY